MLKTHSSLFLFVLLLTISARGEKFIEKVPIYGAIKPAQMTTMVAVNNGMVTKIYRQVGDQIKPGKPALAVIEKETTRFYRSTIAGRVAKLHVTNSATVTPGMPLVTVINPKKKKIEVSFSPEEAKKVKLGAEVFLRGKAKVFGHVRTMSPLVDPDTGAVLGYIQPVDQVKNLIGDILPLEVSLRTIDDCYVVSINEVEQHIQKYRVEATAGEKACLLQLSKTMKQ